MMALTSAMTIVRHSVMVSLLITTHIPTIMATEETFTASKNADKALESRSFFTMGLRSATKTNEGKNIAIVDAIAPGHQLI